MNISDFLKDNNSSWKPMDELQDDNILYFYRLDEKGNFVVELKLSKLKKDNEKNDVIVQKDLNGNETLRCYSQQEMSRKTCIRQEEISRCINNNVKKSNIFRDFTYEKITNQPPILRTKDDYERELKLNERLIKTHKKTKRDVTIKITLNNEAKTYRLHRFIHIYINKAKPICVDCKTKKDIDKLDTDHKDGDHCNNHPKNLQFLCPPCHTKKTVSQTIDNGTRKKKDHSFSVKVVKTCNKTNETLYEKKFNSISETRKYYHNDERGDEKFFLHSSYLNHKKSKYKREFEDFTLKFEIIYKHRYIEKEEWRCLDTIKDKKGKSRFKKDTFVSNLGRIKIGKKIKLGSLKEGYYIYSGYRVHQLVMEAFDPEGYMKVAEENLEKYKDEFPGLTLEMVINTANQKYSVVIDHIDQDKTNNRLSNLRYSSCSDNSRNTSNNNIVCVYNLYFEFIGIYDCYIEAAEELFKKFGIAFRSASISRCCKPIDDRSRRHTYKNFFFLHKEDLELYDNDPRETFKQIKHFYFETNEEKALKSWKPILEDRKKYCEDNKIDKKSYRPSHKKSSKTDEETAKIGQMIQNYRRALKGKGNRSRTYESVNKLIISYGFLKWLDILDDRKIL